MIEIPIKTVGERTADGSPARWEELPLGEPWLRVVAHLAPGSVPTDIQVKAIRDGELMTSRRNLLVAGPTNSGKSLLAYLALFRGVTNGGRVLLLVSVGLIHVMPCFPMSASHLSSERSAGWSRATTPIRRLWR